MTWRRCDLWELPDVGDEITLVSFTQTSIKVWERMKVEVVFTEPTPRIFGPMLPYTPPASAPPERPDDAPARLLMWRLRE